MDLVIGLIVFALLLAGIFPWLDRARLADRSEYDIPLADGPLAPPPAANKQPPR